MTLTEEVKKQIWTNRPLRLKIMTLLDILDSRTLRSMLKRNDPHFLRIDILGEIGTQTGKKQEDLISKN